MALRGDVKPAPQLKKEYVQVLRDREAKYSGGNKRAIGVLDSVESEAHVKLKAKDARVGDKEAKREARLDRGPKVSQYDDDKPEAALKDLVIDKFERAFLLEQEGARGGHAAAAIAPGLRARRALRLRQGGLA